MTFSTERPDWAPETFGPDIEVSDIDLDKEVFILRDGRRLTEELANQMSDELERTAKERWARGAGRPSLSGGRKHSPMVNFRVPEEIKERLTQAAEQQGRKPSQLAREALDEYLDRHFPVAA